MSISPGIMCVQYCYHEQRGEGYLEHPGACSVLWGRTDQNTGGALMEFSMRTAMHGLSRFSSAISVSDNQQNFTASLSLVTIAQRLGVGLWITG